MSEDLIKRSYAIYALCDGCSKQHQCDEDSEEWCEKGLLIRSAIPSADRPSDPHDITYINALENRIKELEIKRPQGKWQVRFPYKDTDKIRTCSNCNITQTVNVYNGMVRFKFCPYCGARMKGADDEID